MEKVTVFLADWQVLFREGIHFTLSSEDDIEVIGETTDNEEALNFIEGNPPTVAILNANHSKLTGVEVTRRIKQNLPSVGLILVMDNDSEEQLFLAMKSGANTCLTKNTDPDDLVNVIRKVAQGGYPITEGLLTPGIASRIIDEFEAFSSVSEQVNNLLARLTLRESQILRHIADRRSIEQITASLGISEQAIRRQLDLIRTKLVANDHNWEVIEAAQKGLPSIISRGEPAVEYITRKEFATFKQTITERLKSLIGELS